MEKLMKMMLLAAFLIALIAPVRAHDHHAGGVHPKVRAERRKFRKETRQEARQEHSEKMKETRQEARQEHREKMKETHQETESDASAPDNTVK